MSNPTPDAERDGFVFDSDSDEWVRREDIVKLLKEWDRIVYSQYRQAWTLCELARFKSDRYRLEEIRKAGEVAGWLLQDLDYEEKENGKNEG